MALINAVEHHHKRQSSLWLRLTTPDYLPLVAERLRILLRTLKSESS